MDQTSLETTSLEGEVVENRNTITLEEADAGIRNGLKDAAQSVITVGYYLKAVRDNELFRSAGYETIWDYAWGEYGFSKGTASRYMKRNDRFSIGGNSPIIADEFRAFNRSQLQEMLSLDAEQMSTVTPDMTVREIRELRRPKEIPYFEIPGQLSLSDFPELDDAETEDPEVENSAPTEAVTSTTAFTVSAEDLIGEPEEKLSAYGLPKRVYPADSLLTTPGCRGDNGRGYDCFNCHLECEIRQEYCRCVDATCGFPFPCQMVDTGKREILEKKIGERCQFIDLNLADHAAGDGSPIPCCKDCETPCEYACENSGKRVATSQQSVGADEQQETEGNVAEKQQTEVWINPEEEHVDENYNLGDMQQTKESLIKRLAALLVRERWLRLKYEFRGISLDTAKSSLKYLQRTQKLELGDGIEAAACEDIIEFFRGTEDLGVCSYERFTTQVQKCLDIEWEKQKEHREAAECNETLQQTEQRSAAVDSEIQEVVDPEDCEEGDDASSAEITDLQLLRDMLDRKKRLLATNLAIPGIDVSDGHIRKQKLEVAALASMLYDLENTIESEKIVDEKPEQPELPRLRNNDQRAAFVDAYETWPLWIETKETGERYYRYELPDGTSFVVKTYHSMLYDYKAGAGMRYKEGYGANEQYILEPGKFFRDCSANRSAMIEKLKELQKSERGGGAA